MSNCIKEEHAVSQEEVQPWHRVGGMEHICELRKSSSVLYGILVTILRQIYSSKKGRVFGCPPVVWKKDPEKTGLWIDTELRWEDMRPDFTPAIYVCLGDIKYQPAPGLGMHGRLYMDKNGEQHYNRTGSCTASFVHVCDKSGESCALADNTENYLSFLQEQIAGQYCFDHFVVLGKTPLRKNEQQQSSGREKISSVVTVQLEWDDSWIVKFETPILKSVDVNDVDRSEVYVAGTNVDVANGEIEIEFGNVSSETDTPVAT